MNSFSSVAHAAIGELLGVNLIFGDEFSSERELVGRSPVQIENFVARTDEFFGSAVTFKTPFHVKCVRFPSKGHLIKLSVACRTTNAVIDVDAMIKKDKIWRIVDAIPAEWFIFCQTFADGREHRRFFPDLRMTGHARFGRRHSGEHGLFDGCMAEAAINSQSENMMLVAERNRLFQRNHFACRPGRPINGVQNPAAAAEQNDRDHDAGAGD